MITFFRITLGILFFSGTVSAKSIFEVSTESMGTYEKAKLDNFLNDIESKLPPLIKNRITHNDASVFRPVKLEFTALTGQPNEIISPKCKVTLDMSSAAAVRKEFADNIKTYGTFVRYDGMIHTAVVPENRYYKILIHKGFLPIILKGPNSATEYGCEFKNLYSLAQAAIVHGVGRIYDLTVHKNKAEKDRCSSIISEVKSKNRMEWPDDALECVDRAESSTLISERVRYRNITQGWSGKVGKYTISKQAFWPRAVNPYAFAYDVRTHFAYNFEHYILDPEYACRKPVEYEYLSQQLGEKGESFNPYHAIESGLCKINTEMRVAEKFMKDDGGSVVSYQNYDLDPKNVESIYFYRAGSGSGAASFFGHSMYRVVGKKGQKLVESCPDEEAYGGSCDLVINHRANPLELRLDSAKGFFGGYPSQLLTSSVYDVQNEYGDGELRNIFNIPIGRYDGNTFTPMDEKEKTRFLYAALEQYWTYIGNYKFISNNCADESMRLFSIASDLPQLRYSNVLTPKQVDQGVFAKLNLLDPNVSKEVAEPGMIRRTLRGIFGQSQKAYQNERRRYETSQWVDESKRYTFYDSLSEILRLEATKGYDNINVISKESKQWLKLGSVSDNPKDICKASAQYTTAQAKRAHVDEKISAIATRYTSLYGKAKNLYSQTGDEKYWETMRSINVSFFVALYHMETMRTRKLGDISVQLAYEIAYPNNGKEMKCKGDLSLDVDDKRKQEIKSIIDTYSALEHALQPYSNLNVAPGYGIPLEKDMVSASFANSIANQENAMMVNMVLALSKELGMDFQLWRELRNLRKSICEDRLRDRLYKDKKIPLYIDEDGQTKNQCELSFPELATRAP